jgi:hypothetical protein
MHGMPELRARAFSRMGMNGMQCGTTNAKKKNPQLVHRVKVCRRAQSVA